ncbi:biotin/lipoyl-binding protein [Chryseobacterium taklimakanense]|uniref:Putative efflux pump membrane fusion protein n=1 Tax=Chryseobacterium taklimakanense TaxID=536441 RepID=A0A239WT42_9FLAO|nr:biotin/lipoyl-binding protein [Chryseobacterium taklimakanense]AZI23060.1 biotin/lipoyl-binding protein [Chryseobacterium taklimakanense]MCG7280874.1 biotin/lipoyl-binding protein [Chryseobacterium taklimakanense]SNV37300.1 putative efflux pump membrane fusion protein [Chryseobacterium taklimakanense]
MKSTSKILSVLTLFTLVNCSEKPAERAIEGKTRKELVTFSPKVTGRILEIYVEEGQTVKAGDTLAKLDVPEVSAKIAQAKGATSAAKAQAQMARNGATADQMRQLRAKQKGLQEQYQYAQKAYNRARNMYRDSLLSPQNYDEAFAKYQGAKAQLDAANAELHDVQIGTRYEKIEMAEGQANQAMGALQEANVAYSERYVIATNDMEIETVSLNKGELATAGFALFSGYIPDTTYFRFTVPESKISAYEKGKTVKMVVNYNQKEITGRIVSIKQLAKYADITTAFPDYNPEDAVYEIKVIPDNRAQLGNILVNSNVVLK